MVSSSRLWRVQLAVAATVIAIGLLGTGCGTTTAPTAGDTSNGTVSRANKDIVESGEKPMLGGKLVYALNSETNGWNPATNQWAPPGLIISRAIFDTITAYDDQSQIKPFLAESFTSNADFTEWTFKLRPGIKLHNGKPANADVVVRNQTYLSKSPVTGPAYKYTAVKAITKKDDLTFTVSLGRGSALYPTAFATQLGVVADPDWLESNDSLKPVGTGPFSMDRWEIGNKLTVKKNADYWRKDANGTKMPYLDSVEFRMIPDNEARGKALQAKDVDVIQTFAGQQVVDFQEQRGSGLQIFSDAKGESRENMVMLNTMVKPFDDPDARLALAYATDKKTYSEVVTGGFNEVANGPVSPSSPWFTPTEYPQYDPVKAKELVEKVKARNGGKFEFTLQGIAEPETQQGAQVLQSQWQAAGITVTADLQEGAKVIIGVVAGSYQAVVWSQFDSPNPFADGVWWDPELAVPPPEFTLNFARNKDDLILDALVKGAGTADLNAQKEAMATVQKRLAADVPYVWLNHLRQTLIATPRVVNLVNWTLPDGGKGLEMNQGGHPLTQVWLRS